MGGIAKSVDYHPIMLLVARWNIWLAFYEKFVAETISYNIYAIYFFPINNLKHFINLIIRKTLKIQI